MLPRAFLTGTGNTCLYMYFLYMMTIQNHKENFEPEDYRMEWRSGVICLALIVLPLYSVLLFFVSQHFSLVILRLLTKFNIARKRKIVIIFHRPPTPPKTETDHSLKIQLHSYHVNGSQSNDFFIQCSS